MVNLTIDNKQISVPEGTTILEAAEQNGIPIPRLCDRCMPCLCGGIGWERTPDSFLQQCCGRRNGNLH